jgi:hypothetical protein
MRKTRSGRPRPPSLTRHFPKVDAGVPTAFRDANVDEKSSRNRAGPKILDISVDGAFSEFQILHSFSSFDLFLLRPL